MQAMGASPADIDRARAQWESQQQDLVVPTIEVYPENIPFLQALLLLADQWEFPDGFGGGRLAIGLAEREVAMRICGIATTQEGHQRMAAMLGAAREAMRKKLEAEAAASRKKR